MSQLFRAAVLFAAMGAVMSAGSLTSPAPAQGKKGGAAKEEIGTTEVYKAKDGWRFRIKDNSGKSVAIGTKRFETAADAEKMIDFIRATLSKGKVDVLKEEKKK